MTPISLRNLVSLGTCICATSALFACSARDVRTERNAAPAVPLAVARQGSVIERIEVRGHVGPPAGSSVKLAFAEAGIVRAVDVEIGQRVRAGERVAELDRAALAPPLAQAQADARSAAASYAAGVNSNVAVASAGAKVVAAQTKLQALERNGFSSASGAGAATTALRQAALKVASDDAALARGGELFAAGVVARKDLDALRTQRASDRAELDAAGVRATASRSDFQSEVSQAKADVAAARSDERAARSQGGVLEAESASARAKLDAARVAFANGELSAPSYGIVLAILKHPGEAVDPSVPVVEIGPPAAQSLTFLVSADIARRIVPGDAVTARLGQSSAVAAAGRVVAVLPVIDRATQVATIVANAILPGAVPGDGVSASIAIGRARGIVVPLSAVVEDPQTGKTVVFVPVDRPAAGESNFVMRTVALGASDASRVAIAAGLRPGERVAAQGGYMLLAPAGN